MSGVFQEIVYYATRCEGGWDDQLVWLDPTTGNWFRGTLAQPHAQGALDAPDLQSRLQRDAGGRQLHFARCLYQPGQRHLRIHRGESIPDGSLDPREAEARRGCLAAVRPLVRELRELFEVVEPVTKNREAYGRAFRDLLILACTEVEAGWRGVLRTNGVNPERPGTVDYVRLLPEMRLDEYSFALRLWPEYGAIVPFHGWCATKPTQSLHWYNAYNQTKHDREANLSLANLERAIGAVAAVLALGCAQFGPEHFSDADAGNDLFVGRGRPTFPPEERFYEGPGGPFVWEGVPLRDQGGGS